MSHLSECDFASCTLAFSACIDVAFDVILTEAVSSDAQFSELPDVVRTSGQSIPLHARAAEWTVEPQAVMPQRRACTLGLRIQFFSQA
jgi:hypothetical protein